MGYCPPTKVGPYFCPASPACPATEKAPEDPPTGVA